MGHWLEAVSQNKVELNVEIPDNAFWGGLAAVVGWLLTLERRLGARPTRTEHEAMAAKVATDVKGQFDEVKRMLREQNEGSRRRDEALADIRTKVAVLRDRAGDDPLAETGAHRRRL